MGFRHSIHKLMGSPVSPKPEPSILDPYYLPTMPRIELYPEALSRLNAARTSGDAIAVVVAYVRPKVDARGEAGSPLLAFNSLEMDCPQRSTEIQLVRRALGFHRIARIDRSIVPLGEH